MKLEPWEPDLRTLRDRVRERDLDLQPDFQRGSVWPIAKQQKLVDTILRGWAVPAIHLLVLEDHRLAVLDGQQRLNAMIDFLDDRFRVARFEPLDPKLEQYTGLKFTELDESTQRRILSFKVSSYRLYEYDPAEPYELFFRLNLPTGLTQAEKRNALVGGAREQVKELVAAATSSGWSKESLGFENTRLAYDDVIARLCEYTEIQNLRHTLTSSTIEKRYRSEAGFSQSTLEITRAVIAHIGQASPRLTGRVNRLNKASLISWSLALARKFMTPGLSHVDVDDALYALEMYRANLRTIRESSEPRSNVIEVYAQLFADRASLRVADVLSVVARDVCIWRVCKAQWSNSEAFPLASEISPLLEIEEHADFSDALVLDFLEAPKSWGTLR
ncbi:DUF262 domain-containing protein [Plantibacter sp. T3]|uniref:DUF262 domain-containing protein n=1 Tax=Plantibacter sp. T3 TaxID=2653161 RepID=UPI0012F1477A|nr:DUF262 domain-containing protein [Plantibacter sp. T3]VXC32644.1 conserved hypothetical protein [Plantibacter sp. T3]